MLKEYMHGGGVFNVGGCFSLIYSFKTYLEERCLIIIVLI